MKVSTLLIALVTSTIFQGCTCCPSDEALIDRFYLLEQHFDRLAVMALEDEKVTRIAKDFTWVEGNAGWPRPASELGFSVERWDEYRELFKKLGIGSGISRGKGGMVFFSVAVSGLVTGGSQKGYAFSKTKPSPLLASLNGRPKEIKSLEAAYRHIKGNWYIFYMWDD